MQVAYIGNFEPPHSTENHVARALEHNGHTVIRLQENRLAYWELLATGVHDVDFFLWTRTGWPWAHYGTSDEDVQSLQHRFLLNASRAKIPVVGFHLDIWWGLKREYQIAVEPFFRSDIVITADGGHDERWVEAGVNHVWMPPGISLAEAEYGTPKDDYASPIAFVGSHDGSYHQEHQHRHELVNWLRQNFRRDCAFWPRPGEHAVRGGALQDLYASVAVVVGDSCFAGTGLANYWSDRIPETLGRGGILLHPEVPGLDEHFGSALLRWEAYDWNSLGGLIESVLAMDVGQAGALRDAGRDHVRQHHTYERRMEQVVELLYERKLLKRPAKKKAVAK